MVASDECYLALSAEPRPARSRCCTPTSAAARTEGCSRCTRCRSRPTSAGYRAGFVAGDPALVAALLEVRKHAGHDGAAAGAGGDGGGAADDAHVAAQARRYARRRERLRAALEAAGLRVEHSEAGLYLWATAGEHSRTTVDRLAGAGRRWSHRASSTARRATGTCGSR